MIRNPSFRRIVIAISLFMGLFSQFQTVFACELMSGVAQYICCCDEPGAMGCEKGGACHDQSGAGGEDCCTVSYQQVLGSIAIAPASHAQQVLLLNAPQPPPIPVSFDFQNVPPANHATRIANSLPPPVAGIDTYLLTNRFRI